MICDTWHVTHGVGWTFSQIFSCLALMVWDLWCCEYLEEKGESLNELISDEAVYRTAPATPGLLKLQEGGSGHLDVFPKRNIFFCRMASLRKVFLMKNASFCKIWPWPHPTPLPRPLPPHPTTAGMTVGQLDAWIRGQFHSNSFNSFNGWWKVQFIQWVMKSWRRN